MERLTFFQKIHTKHIIFIMINHSILSSKMHQTFLFINLFFTIWDTYTESLNVLIFKSRPEECNMLQRSKRGLRNQRSFLDWGHQKLVGNQEVDVTKVCYDSTPELALSIAFCFCKISQHKVMLLIAEALGTYGVSVWKAKDMMKKVFWFIINISIFI